MKRSWTDLEPSSVAKAIELWHGLGSDEFIARTRFEESRRYVVIDEGQRIASKPLLAMAFQVQFGCGKEGPPRLSGGEQTRNILARLGYELVDTYLEVAQDSRGPLKIAIRPGTRLWWVNQTANFDPVYGDGTLWAPLENRDGRQVDHWRTLYDVQPGDLVIHYASPEIRGLSQVATFQQPSYPPRGYNDVPPDTRGILVLTEPLHQIRLHRDRALDMLESGRGPLTASGNPRRGYLFPLDTDRALELLRQVGLETTSEAPNQGGTRNEPSDRFLPGPTDRMAIVAVRAEQRFLREQQLRRWGASCSLCGRSVPEELLVAAHIKPRWACTEEERMDTRNVSMLACLFGCDALFELGYVVINEQGAVELGSRGSLQIADHVREIVGRRCPAHGEESRHYFAWHRQHHSGKGSHRSAEEPRVEAEQWAGTA